MSAPTLRRLCACFYFTAFPRVPVCVLRAHLKGKPPQFLCHLSGDRVPVRFDLLQSCTDAARGTSNGASHPTWSPFSLPGEQPLPPPPVWTLVLLSHHLGPHGALACPTRRCGHWALGPTPLSPCITCGHPAPALRAHTHAALSHQTLHTSSKDFKTAAAADHQTKRGRS